MRKFKLIGRKFGRLTVLSFDSWFVSTYKNKRHAKYLCECDCGNKKSIVSIYLIKGVTKSCGCYREECSKKQGKINGLRLGNANSGFTSLFYSYKGAAKSRNYIFNLTKEKFKEITSKNCYYCNKKPSQVKNKQAKKSPFSKDYIYNGIDRIDNSLGYTVENSRPCCGVCNKMRMDLTEIEFLDKIKLIYENLNVVNMQH